MKKVYVSAVERILYEVHKAPHHDDGEKPIEVSDDDFAFIMRLKAENKKMLGIIIPKYTESELQPKK